jgi:exopolysaccharide biosynthesis polyprenyl glycosylphosphotransferase
MKMPLLKKDHRERMVIVCANLAIATDLVAAMFALLIAHKIRYALLPNARLIHDHLVTCLTVVFGALLFVILMAVLEGYRRHILIRSRRSLPIIFKATFAWLVAFPAVTLFFEILPSVSRIFILVGATLIFLLVSCSRYFLHLFLRSRGYTEAFRQRVLLIDWTDRLDSLATEISKDPWHPYEIAGIAPPPGNRFTKSPSGDYPVLGSHAELERLFAEGLIQIAVLGDGDWKESETAEMASLCERHLVNFMMIPSGFQILLTGLQITTISSVPVLGIMELPLEKPLNALLKRSVDLIGAMVGLILFAPLILFFCILVYVESPGPVFYRQVRSGRKGKHFEIIKIRSMKPDAERESGARWATKDDPRRLRCGAFMRRWNIDELPQFWNVLIGEMSLVGPRPERPELIVGFKETVDHYNARHHVTPGLTGWAAVNGLRGDTDLVERIRYDLYYMENWSLALDIQIMLMTFFRWEGAA